MTCDTVGMSKRKPERVYGTVEPSETETGPGSAGQSGDLQGLSGVEGSDNESVQELVEEGQYNEAAAVEGVENAPDADEGGIRTRQVPEDDVPQEYIDEQ